MAFLTGMDDDSSKEEFKLLYTTICEHAPPVEHEEIKRVLGREVVEETRNEVGTRREWTPHLSFAYAYAFLFHVAT